MSPIWKVFHCTISTWKGEAGEEEGLTGKRDCTISLITPPTKNAVKRVNMRGARRTNQTRRAALLLVSLALLLRFIGGPQSRELHDRQIVIDPHLTIPRHNGDGTHSGASIMKYIKNVAIPSYTYQLHCAPPLINASGDLPRRNAAPCHLTVAPAAVPCPVHPAVSAKPPSQTP